MKDPFFNCGIAEKDTGGFAISGDVMGDVVTF